MRLVVGQRRVERNRLGEQVRLHAELRSHDTRLRSGHGVRHEPRDPPGEPVDERVDLVGRQYPVDPTPTLGRCRIDVVTAEDDFERPAPADETWQSHRAARARKDPEGDLGLAEDRIGRRESHVAPERQLAAATADPSPDHGDGRLRHRPQGLAHLVVRADLGRDRLDARELLDRLDIEVGEEPLGVRRTDHHRANRVVVGKFLDRRPQFEEHLHRDQVDRRMVDRDRCNSPIIDHRAHAAHGTDGSEISSW